MARDPFFGPNPVVAGLEQRRAHVEQVRQNTTRLAQSYNFVETTGVGSIQLPTVVEFGCTFVEIPVVSYGATLESPLPATDFPMTTGAVYSWVTDTRGFYTGAYVYVVVTGDDPDTAFQHDFTFTGIAMKDLPTHLLDL